jgi:hypothetical protein
LCFLIKSKHCCQLLLSPRRYIIKCYLFICYTKYDIRYKYDYNNARISRFLANYCCNLAGIPNNAQYIFSSFFSFFPPSFSFFFLCSLSFLFPSFHFPFIEPTRSTVTSHAAEFKDYRDRQYSGYCAVHYSRREVRYSFSPFLVVILLPSLSSSPAHGFFLFFFFFWL